MSINSETDAIPEAFQEAHLEKLLGSKGHFCFNCTACGTCCQGEGRVYFTDQDLENIYGYLDLDEESEKLLYGKVVQKRRGGFHVHEGTGPCYFLDSNKRCKIYPVRPLQCRSFPFWPSIFASKAALAESRAECPGMQKATPKAFTIEETASKIRNTHEQFIEAQANKSVTL